MMFMYQAERIHDVRGEITPMLYSHYEEIATHKEVKPLSIDWDGYYELEAVDRLRIVTARRKREPLDSGLTIAPQSDRGELIGYCVTFIVPHLHYQETVMAMNDILYITPEHRGGTVGVRLLKFAVADLQNCGAQVLTVHMKTDYPFRSLLEHIGFSLTEENWELLL